MNSFNICNDLTYLFNHPNGIDVPDAGIATGPIPATVQVPFIVSVSAIAPIVVTDPVPINDLVNFPPNLLVVTDLIPVPADITVQVPETVRTYVSVTVSFIFPTFTVPGSVPVTVSFPVSVPVPMTIYIFMFMLLVLPLIQFLFRFLFLLPIFLFLYQVPRI